MNGIKKNAPAVLQYRQGAKEKTFHVHNSREWEKKQARKETILEVLTAAGILSAGILTWILLCGLVKG